MYPSQKNRSTLAIDPLRLDQAKKLAKLQGTTARLIVEKLIKDAIGEIEMTYDSSGAGLQRFDNADYFAPPQENIPDGAKFGLWDFDTEVWLNEWYYDHNDAQHSADEVSRSGFNYGIVSIDGWEYFNPSGFE